MRLRSQSFGGAAIFLGMALGLAGATQQSKSPEKVEPPKKAEQPKKKRVLAELSGFELEDPSKKRAEETRLGATRGMLQPKLLAPQRTKLYGDSALFAWSYGGKATRFTVVFTDDGKNEVFRAEANGNEYRLPARAFRWQPGKAYWWSVATATPMLGASPSVPAGLVVVSASERSEIEKALAAIPKGDEYTAGLACAKVFTDHRLWFDAIGAYTELIAKFPDRAELYEQRGMIYAQLEATQALAEADFARADELNSGPRPGN